MIILTGASGGLGRNLVSALAKLDNVLAVYHRHPPEFAPIENVATHQLDVREKSRIDAMLARWQPDFGQLTVVHGAACSIDGLAVHYKEADWDQVMDVNLKGDYLLTQALLPHMMRTHWGRIIHLSSIVGTQGEAGTVAYAASKSALSGLSRVLAKEYGRFNITSNVIALGYFAGGLTDRIKESKQEELLSRIPGKRFGDTANIAHAVRFLRDADYVNGATISIDGGM